jgi:hypothetical protein
VHGSCSANQGHAANTGSRATLNLATSWIATCRSRHRQCNQWIEDAPYHPSRLLDLHRPDPTTAIRLIELSDSAPEGPYATLSHRWGNQSFPRLLDNNLATFKDQIRLEILPPTWVDAISVTKSLGLRYLWIDALCILQDSSEDWNKEAALMHRIYSNSFCNIAATGASHNEHGCFFDRSPTAVEPCHADVRWGGTEQFKHLLINQDYWLDGVADAPLNRRAWVVQERLLAPRVLHFGRHQVYWECQELEACEAFPYGIPRLPGDRETGISGFKDLRTESRSPDTVERPMLSSSESFKAYQLWTKIVIAFSRGALTVKEDKLPALAGIAQRMAGLLEDQYLAGVWRRFLVDELCWSATSQTSGVLQMQPFRPTQYRAPSWSWTSLEGRITPDSYGYGISLIDILHAQVELASHNSFGSVKSGYLLVRGYLSTFEIIGDLIEPAHGWSTTVNRTAFGKNVIEIMLDDVANTVQKDLYCLPIKYLPEDDADGYGPWLRGLILQQTGPTQEHYRRVGAFFLPDDMEAIRAFQSQREDQPTRLDHESKVHDRHTITII